MAVSCRGYSHTHNSEQFSVVATLQTPIRGLPRSNTCLLPAHDIREGFSF
jgi:hypothetical protein